MTNRRERVQRLMLCLGDPSRFHIVRQLLRGPRCVTDLAAEVGLSQSCTTRHLQALQRESLVAGERDGKRVVFRLRLDEPQVEELLSWALEAATVRRRAGGRGSGATPAAPRPRREIDAGPRTGPRAPRRVPGVEPRATADADPPPRPRPPRQELEDYLL